MSSAYFKSSRVSDAISEADSHKRFRVSINKFYRVIDRRITCSIQWVFFSILYEYEEKKQQELAMARLKKSGIYSSFYDNCRSSPRSLANFYCQYADRHMSLKFMRRVSEREPAIRQFVIAKDKLTSVFYATVLLLILNFIITLSK